MSQSHTALDTAITSLRQYRDGEKQMKDSSVMVYLCKIIKDKGIPEEKAELIRNLYRSRMLIEAIDKTFDCLDDEQKTQPSPTHERHQSMIVLKGSRDAQQVIRSWILGQSPSPRDLLTAIDTIFPPDRHPTKEIRIYLTGGVISIGTYLFELIHFCINRHQDVDLGWMLGYAPPPEGVKWRRCSMLEQIPRAKNEIEGAMAVAQMRECFLKEATNARH